MTESWFDEPFFDPDALPRVLDRHDALARGLTAAAVRWRLTRRLWTPMLPGVYRTGSDVTRWDLLDAALAYAGREALISGAAALWASAIKVPFPDRILVLVPVGVRPRASRWVLVRPSARPVEQLLDTGPRRVATARAAADHALTLKGIDDVRHLIARVVRDGQCSLDELAAELARGPRNGSKLLRQALAEVADGAASAPEARAARALRRADVPPFEQNAVIPLPGGGHYVADFYWRALRAILEIDSVEYHLDPAQWRRTMDRHLILETLGHSVIHRPPSAVKDERRFAAEVSAWLHSLAATRTA
jgi:hypothetical protein